MALTPYHQLQQVKEHYNSIGQHFAQTRRKKIQAELIPLINEVHSGMKVLDVGCGSGRLLTELINKKITYTGMDFSRVLLQQARLEYPNRRFLLRDITTEHGWRNIGQYDALFCLGVLHHIPDRRRQHMLLQQMYQHTKPGGFLVMSVWNLWHTRFWNLHLRQLSKKIEYGDWQDIWVPYSSSDGVKATKTVQRFCRAFFAGEVLSLVKQVGYQVTRYYYGAKGNTHLSLLKGDNFCLVARKRV